MFKKDQLVVYPAQGVGIVESVTEKEVGGIKTNFYIIRILSNNGTVMIPVNNAENVGLRCVCDPEYGQNVLKYLADWSDFKGYAGQNWNRRYREYAEKLKSGELIDVAYVLKELILISQDKELSFGERRLMEHAMSLITTELSYSLSRDKEDIKDEISRIFKDIIQNK
ncbi:CarD family transcriptional regulator [Desulfothermus okinawensis JCM 13304]